MTPMSPVWGHVAGVFIILMLVTFIGIWIWAWRKRHQATFDRMARLPLEQDEQSDSDVDAKEDRP
ncbi:MAG: cbb3-type cytochrome c oxidase subunit 3 [Rhodanobacter sp.]|jgi:cytochrome c oxidase cbb3-type subunit 4|uniref:Cbb3-type cytochrome oxidase subunit 3 n=2 Tax=unclassified Rhodanobacter TaxID=2621553 RepID=A0AB74UWZ6_9GAMM|nr:cbb3-type cytochrome c oxidase subunit 3 [Rhodanobacter sp.]MBN8945971.1 cbb3-type cytochrome c oxidase subunit 3 [Rhodanobacter sp.]